MTLLRRYRYSILGSMDVKETICPGCGLQLKSKSMDLAARFNASSACLELQWDLSALTLSLRDKDFIHQLVVDAYAAQHSGANVKPVTTAFALIGLDLVFERGYTGRQVQKVHIALGKTRRQWPHFVPPSGKAALTVRDVLENVSRDSYAGWVYQWGKSVWDLWQAEHVEISRLVHQSGF